MAKSTHEVELIALAYGCDEALWLRRIMVEIGFVFGLTSRAADTVCAEHEETVMINYIGAVKLTEIEEQAFSSTLAVDDLYLKELVRDYLLDGSPVENKLMLTITPAPSDRFTFALRDYKLQQQIAEIGAFITATTADGTRRRFTTERDIDTDTYKVGPTLVATDNKSVSYTVKNPITSTASRHLDVRWFRIREYIKEGLVRVCHIFTTQNVSDFFTKALEKAPFLRLRQFLMNN